MPVVAHVLMAIPRAAASKLIVPVGDGDNFEKAIYDLIQKKGYLADDKWITTGHWKKRFVPHGTEGYTEIKLMAEEEAIDGKKCTRCDTWKPLPEFYQDSSAKDGRASQCAECIKHQVRWQKLLVKFGITPEQYAQLLVEQEHVCAICKGSDSSGRALAVDHDHTTGEIRGLLCSRCNPGLGQFQDDPTLLQAAIDYLRR